MSDAKPDDLSVREYAAYKLVKPITDAIGSVPIAGPIVLDSANVPCKVIDAFGGALGGNCVALQTTLGELDAPAFPKVSSPAGHAK